MEHGLIPKMSKETFLALTNNPEVNKKKGMHGSLHPKWIEDRTKVKFRPRYEMTIWTKQVFERDNYICQICGQRGGKLQADHIKSYRNFPELRWELSNGRTLCESCHKKTPNYGDKPRRNLNV